MQSDIAGGLHKTQDAVPNTTPSKDLKMVDFEGVTVNMDTEQAMTTDHGTRVENADNWLKAMNNGKRSGPLLLEDQIARERVCRSFVP